MYEKFHAKKRKTAMKFFTPLSFHVPVLPKYGLTRLRKIFGKLHAKIKEAKKSLDPFPRKV